MGEGRGAEAPVGAGEGISSFLFSVLPPLHPSAGLTSLPPHPQIAKKVGCPMDDTARMAKCLKVTDPRALTMAYKMPLAGMDCEWGLHVGGGPCSCREQEVRGLGVSGLGPGPVTSHQLLGVPKPCRASRPQLAAGRRWGGGWGAFLPFILLGS